METNYYCPLVKNEISENSCLEYCTAVEGMIKMRNVDGFNGSREEAEKICFNCENYRE